jgi:hypothetical protein
MAGARTESHHHPEGRSGVDHAVQRGSESGVRIEDDREAFSESDLPCRVDLADWHGIAARWRQIIMAERAALTEPAPRDPAG